MALKHYSTEKLKEELNRRETIPDVQPLTMIRFDEVKKQVIEAVEKRLKDGEWPDDDSEHYIYEAAVEAVYGDDIFKRLRDD